MKKLTGSLVTCKRPLAVGILFLVNALHPFVHLFEGGMLDPVLMQLNMFVMHMDPYLPHHHEEPTSE